MPCETWSIYKKTKHRVGFRRPERGEFRLPRSLLPERFAVGAEVSYEWGQEDGMAELTLELASENDSSVDGQIGQTPEAQVRVEPDRWIVWKTSSEYVGVTGATGKLRETGKFKIPPDLLPRDCQSGDFLFVQSVVSPIPASWVVLLENNKAWEGPELLRLVE